MPRVTRRSLAAKEPEESTPEPPKSARGKRGAKREIEESPSDEQIEAPAKRGRNAAEPKTPTRGRRGKKQEEPDPDHDEKESEQIEDEQIKSPAKSPGAKRGRGRGRGRGAGKRGGRSGSKGKVTEDESESIEDKEDDSQKESETDDSQKESEKEDSQKEAEGGVKEAESQEKESEEVCKEDEKMEEVSDDKEKSSEVTEDKAEEKQSDEVDESKKEASEELEEEKKIPSASPVKEKVTETESTLENDPKDQIIEKIQEEQEKDKTSKKRKLDEDEEESEIKRQKTKVPIEDNNELKDYVVVNTDEVPAPDSKEVAACISKAEPPPSADSDLKDYVVVEKNEVPASDSKEIADVEAKAVPPPPENSDISEKDQMPAPVVNPTVIPLTEAELTKRYTDLHREKEADETSSILVEIGSEANSEIGNISVRGLDVSEANSMESTADQTSNNSDPPSTPAPTISSQSSEPVKEVAASPQSAPQKQVELPKKETNSFQGIIGEASSKDSSSGEISNLPAVPQTPPAPAVVSNKSTEAVKEVSPSIQTKQTGSPQKEPVSTTFSPKAQTVQTTVSPAETKHQNGVVSPVKSSVKSSVPYVPSSTSITKRKFISNPNFPAELMDPAFCFSVVAYNILADCHLRRGDYSFTKDPYLEQNYRHNLMMTELDYLAGDVVCLQEVDPTYYKSTLLPAMSSRGYEGYFTRRTKEYYNEGEATFVKKTKFDIDSTQTFSLKDLAFKEIEAANLSEEIAGAARKYLDRADIVLLSKLRCKKTGKLITVGNIHVVYDPKAPDVQCIQVASAIKELVSKAGNDLDPHIICGDFNSTPLSPAYQLATDGYLSDSHIRDLQALESMDNTNGASRSVINHLWKAFQHTSTKLRSAYKITLGTEPFTCFWKELPSGSEPEVSTFHGNTRDSLDYIFHSSSSLDTVGVLQTLDPPVVDATGGLPSKDVPSDHLSLKAIFRIK